MSGMVDIYRASKTNRSSFSMSVYFIDGLQPIPGDSKQKDVMN